MNNYIKASLGFIAGLLLGAGITKLYVAHTDKKEETVSITQNFENEDEDKNENTKDEVKIDRSNDDDKIQYSRLRAKDGLDEYEEILNRLNYKVEDDRKHAVVIHSEEGDQLDKTKPYYINKAEYEYDALDAFDFDEYTYYADGYVTDSYGMPVSDEDISENFGSDFAKYFEKYQVDEICIRNEKIKMDFSIIRDLDNFMDVVPSRIRRMAGL